MITQDTTLQNDVVGCTGDGIVIGADGITLDLNGHTVAGSCDAGCAGTVGIDNTAGHDGVGILNGSIHGFGQDVGLMGADDNALANLTVGGFPVVGPFVGISLSQSHNNTIDGVTVLGGDPAVLLSGSDGNAISNGSFDGGVSIRVGRSVEFRDGSDNNQLERSRLNGEAGAAIFDSADNRVVNNEINGDADGLALAGAQGNLIARNTLTSSGFGAITLVMQSKSDENVIRDNDMPSGGIVIRGDRNRIERNDVRARFAFFDQSAIDVLSGDANEVVLNRAREGADNVAVRADATATLVLANMVTGALDDGIDVDAPGTLIRANEADNNGDFGIEAVEGVIDGGGNRASGNGNPAQCLNVVCH